MERIPPHNLEYETSIIAGCILWPDQRETVLDILTPENFYRTAHQKIYQSISTLVNQKEPVDLNTIVNQLRKTNDIEGCGGAVRIGEIVEAGTPPDPEHYAQKILQMSKARDLINASLRTLDACYSYQDDFSNIIDNAQRSVIEIDDGEKARFMTMDELTEKSVERYQALNAGKGRGGIKTGFTEIDAVTGGFRGSKLIIIAARPRIGKTAMMMTLTRSMAKHGRRVGIFSLEMDKEELDDRLFAMESGLNTMKFATGTGPDGNDWDRLIEAAGRKSQWPVLIDDSGLGLPELKRRCRKMRKAGVEIIFIDQLSKIRGGEGRTKYEKASSIVNQIADLKKELRMPICLLAQINRAGTEAPSLEHLKDTGSLEEDADIVFLGHRKYVYTKHNDDKYKAQWEIAKQRGGPERIIKMNWHPKTTMFSEDTTL